jgi:helix-turn-helix protein
MQEALKLTHEQSQQSINKILAFCKNNQLDKLQEHLSEYADKIRIDIKVLNDKIVHQMLYIHTDKYLYSCLWIFILW